jgi:hypothetical protein
MKLQIIILVLPVLIYAERSVFYQRGQRKLNDRSFAIYTQQQGPFAGNQTLNFYFEHLLDGKHFTSFTLSGEPIYVSQI